MSFWRITVTSFLAVLSFFGSWIFLEVVDTPKVYATKHEMECMMSELKAIHGTVNEINRYLRGANWTGKK